MQHTFSPGGRESRYPLTGIRAATTGPQERLIERATRVLHDDPRVLGAWLGGSFWTGGADGFSDVDVHVVVGEADIASLKTSWRDVLERITPTVLSTDFPAPLVGGYAVSPEWERIDLVFHPRSEIGTVTVGSVLVDRVGLVESARPVAAHEPYFPDAVVRWFFYILGHLVIVIGRREYALGVSGAMTVRDTALLPLLYAERGIVRYGGAKRLNPFLSEDQQRLLEALPSLAPTADSIIDFHVAVAREFIARGRRLADSTGATWPDDLERAAVGHLERMLGIGSVLRSPPPPSAG